MRKSTGTAPASTSTPRRSGRDTDTERRILDAAHIVFLERGTAGARMQDIAREAGVNQALLHYYFRSKDRLSEAVFRRAASQLFRSVIDVMASDAALEDKVARVVRLEIDHLRLAPSLPGYILSELTHHPERARQLISMLTGSAPEDIRRRVLAALRREIDERVRAGTMREIAPEQFMVNLISLCIFPFAARPMLVALLGFDEHGFERFIAKRRQTLAPFFLRALRP